VITDGRIERRRRVETEQLEAHHAEMHAGDGPVAQPRGSEGAAVADAVAQDAPREGQLVAILPRDAQHFGVVERFLVPEPLWRERDPAAAGHDV
jgi:hypothetical protein